MAETCRARARSTGLRCKREATLDGTDAAGGIPCCGWPEHVTQLLEVAAPVEIGEETAPIATDRSPHPPTLPAPDPEPEQLDDELRELLASVPPAPELQLAAAIAESADPAAADDAADERIEAAAERLVGDVDDDAAAVDASAAEQAAARASRSSPAATPRPELAQLRAGAWGAARCEFYLRLAINPRLEADGKDPLTDEELEEGGQLAAVVLSDLFGARAIENPYGALTAWAAVVIGTRYVDEIFVQVAGAVRWIRRKRAAAPASTPAPSPASSRNGPPAAPASTARPADRGIAWGQL
jgi:hypothetical protein